MLCKCSDTEVRPDVWQTCEHINKQHAHMCLCTHIQMLSQICREPLTHTHSSRLTSSGSNWGRVIPLTTIPIPLPCLCLLMFVLSALQTPLLAPVRTRAKTFPTLLQIFNIVKRKIIYFPLIEVDEAHKTRMTT